MAEVIEAEVNEEEVPLEGELLKSPVREYKFKDLQELADYIKITNSHHGEIQSGIDRSNNQKVYLLQLK